MAENSGTKDSISVEELYREVAASYRYIADWRHRVLTRFFVSSSALAGAAAWLANQNSSILNQLVFLPSAIGLLMSTLCWAMDRRDRELTQKCYEVAHSLEDRFASADGIYSAWCRLEKSPVRYGKILPILYILGAIAFLLGLVASFIWL